MQEIHQSRRDFLKIAGYAAPVVLTLSVMPAFAQSGSGITVPEPIDRILNSNDVVYYDDGPNDERPVKLGKADFDGDGPNGKGKGKGKGKGPKYKKNGPD